jgi:predicted RNA binding protein YcfA (HicA-like mRNA interferase family)
MTIQAEATSNMLGQRLGQEEGSHFQYKKDASTTLCPT